MGQNANARRETGNEAKAYGKYFRISPQKLNLVAQTIRGKNAGRALTDLEFSKKRIAQDVRKLLQSAISNAENNHGLDVDQLVISEATVGKTMVMKRFVARARGRGARIEKKFSNMTIIVKQQEAKV
jgi:large subunit ribosomal protein L22